MVSRFCEVIPSTLSAMEEVLGKVMLAAQSLPCAPGELEDIELVLREALANAIVHGNNSDPGKKVIVACFCECGAEAGGGLLLVIGDEGAGFDPDGVPDPTNSQNIYAGHGRGIFLMRQLMDEVRYQNGGSEIELRKRRK